MIVDVQAINPNIAKNLLAEKNITDYQYVCTTELEVTSTKMYDIFYVNTPQRDYKNKYVGLTIVNRDRICIVDADKVENMTFAAVQDGNSDYHYSRNRHDFVSLNNGNFIDGGRSYYRTNVRSEDIMAFNIVDGQKKII